jgi:hypothetical protein
MNQVEATRWNWKGQNAALHTATAGVTIKKFISDRHAGISKWLQETK